jgi:adenosine deaminase
VFEKVRTDGFKVVAHAGEEGSAEYVWQALLTLKAKRVDHGIRCLEDEKLIEYLSAYKTPLTVCPLSNLKLKVVKKL